MLVVNHCRCQNTQELEFRIEGMDCPACAATIEKSIGKINGVQSVRVNYSTAKMQTKVEDPEEQVSVNFSTGKMKIAHQTNTATIMREVEKAGYKAISVSQTQSSPQPKSFFDGLLLTSLSGITLLLGFVLSLVSIPSILPTLLYAAVSYGYS